MASSPSIANGSAKLAYSSRPAGESNGLDTVVVVSLDYPDPDTIDGVDSADALRLEPNAAAANAPSGLGGASHDDDDAVDTEEEELVRDRSSSSVG